MASAHEESNDEVDSLPKKKKRGREMQLVGKLTVAKPQKQYNGH